MGDLPQVRERERIETRPADVLAGLLHDRWSCRAFLDRQVPAEVVARLFAMAQRSASWCNTQPWRVEVTSGDATDRLRSALGVHIAATGRYSRPDYPMPSNYSGAHRDRRRVSGWQLYEAVGVERGDRAASARQAVKNYEFFDAPHVAIVTVADELGTYGVLDAGIYIGTLLLAAQSLGLAAIPQAALARYAPFIRDHFKIDASRQVLLAVSFGYPDLEHPANSYRTERAAFDDVVNVRSN